MKTSKHQPPSQWDLAKRLERVERLIEKLLPTGTRSDGPDEALDDE